MKNLLKQASQWKKLSKLFTMMRTVDINILN